MLNKKNMTLLIAVLLVAVLAIAYWNTQKNPQAVPETTNLTGSEEAEGTQKDSTSSADEPAEASTYNSEEEASAPTLEENAPAGEVLGTQEVAGLKIETLRAGSGKAVVSGDTVSVHYVGTLENGTKFDSSVDRGTPFQTQIGVGRVIEGWDRGIVGMQVGEKRKLTVGPELGYGSRAAGTIPANSTLIFEVELLAIK